MRYKFRIAIRYKFFVYCDIPIYRYIVTPLLRIILKGIISPQVNRRVYKTATFKWNFLITKTFTTNVVWCSTGLNVIFRLICSVLRASNFSVLKLIEIVILWVYYTIRFGFSLFRQFRDNIFYFCNHFFWRMITNEGSLPEMRIWSILFIKSELKWCIHLSRNLFLYS